MKLLPLGRLAFTLVPLSLLAVQLHANAACGLWLFGVKNPAVLEFDRAKTKIERVFRPDLARRIIEASERFLEEVRYSESIPIPMFGDIDQGKRRSTLLGVRTRGFDRVHDFPREIELETDRIDAGLLAYLSEHPRPKHLPVWREIAYFLDDPFRFIIRMMELQAELKLEQPDRELVEITLERTKLEERAGFSEERHETSSYQFPNQGPLNYQTLLDVLANRKLVSDYLLAHTAHGRQTHRIQLALIFLEFESHPERFRDEDGHSVSFIDFYQGLSEVPSVRVDRALGAPGDLFPSTEHPIWDALLDTFYHSPSSPAFIKIHREYWPGMDPHQL